MATPSKEWRRWRAHTDLDEYDERWVRMAAAGEAVHGEADFVTGLGPSSVVDAGCGTGRVAIELGRRGIEVVGIDSDADMLARARRRSSGVTWVLADLAALDLERTFDVVVLAGNVLPFVEPADRAAVVRCCAHHLVPGGHLVTGSSLRPGWPSIVEIDGWATGAGLAPVGRFAGWDREPWGPSSDYVVTVDRLVRPHPSPAAVRAGEDR